MPQNATETDHRVMAESLLKRSRQLRAASHQPDAAGSAIRTGWAKQADVLLAEAQVEAALIEPPTRTGVQA